MTVDPGSRLGRSPSPPPPPPASPTAAASFAAMLDRNSTHSVGPSPTPTPTTPAKTTPAKTNATPKSTSPLDTPAMDRVATRSAQRSSTTATRPAPSTTQPSPVQQAQKVTTAAESKLNQDKQTLKALQAQLPTKPPIGLGAGRGAGAAAAQYEARITQLKSQITATQGQIVSDQAVVATGKSNLAAAQGAAATANSYHPAAPSISVNDPTTSAVMPIVTHATDQVAAGKAQVRGDQTALDQTNAQLQNLGTQMDYRINRGTLQRLSNLNQQQGQQQKKLASDQHNLNAATANLAAGNTVVYGQQATADRNAFSGAAATLKNTGVTLDSNDNPTQKNLTPAQLKAYNTYITAQAKVEADAGMVGRSHAQLQYYASDKKKYGTIAQEAQSNVNRALRPLGLATAPVKGDPQAAKTNLDIANQASDYLNAGLAAANHRVAFNTATNVELNSVQPSDLKGISPQAQQAALSAKANYQQAVAYQGKIGAGLEVANKRQTLATAQAAYDKSPTAGNKVALVQAQQQLQLRTAYAMSDIANANFQAGSANVYANQQLTALARLQQGQGQACIDPNSPLGQQITRAQANVASANLVANNLNAYTGKLLADYNVSQQKNTATALQQALSNAQANGANPDSPGFAKLSGDLTQAQRDSKAAQTQQTLAQYQLSDSQFQLTLPANLLNPQTAADQQALSQAYDSIFAQHKGALTDGKVAQQLAALKGPNDKVDVSQGQKELGQDIKDENTALADRSLLQQGADWVGGLFGANRSQLETTLQGDQAALQRLQGEKNQMNAQDYNAAYLKIMGNLATQDGTMFQNERKTDSNWSTAQEVVRDVAVAGVATVVTLASAGTLTPLVALGFGTLAGVGTAEGIDTAQNASTVFSGGNINADPHISLDAAFSNNFFQGKDSWGELGHAGVDAAVDGVDSFGAAASVGAGSAAGDFATALIKSTTGRAADSALTRIASGSAGMVANQGVMGAGNLGGTVIQTQYQVSQGEITEANAWQQTGDAFKGYVTNLGVAAVTGGITSSIDTGVMKLTGSRDRPSGLVSNPLYQTASNLVVNTVLTSPGVLTGNAPSAKDWLSIGLNTISGMAVHATAESFGQETADSPVGKPIVIDMASANQGHLSSVVADVRNANSAYIPSETPNPSVTVLHGSAFEQAFQDAGGRGDHTQAQGFTVFGREGAPAAIFVRYNQDRNAMEAVTAHEAAHAFTHPAFIDAAARTANTVVMNPDGRIKRLPAPNMIEGVASDVAQQVVPGPHSNPEEAQIAASIRAQMGRHTFDEAPYKQAVFGGDLPAIDRFMQLAGEAGPSSRSAGTTSWDVAASMTPEDPGQDPASEGPSQDPAGAAAGESAAATGERGMPDRLIGIETALDAVQQRAREARTSARTGMAALPVLARDVTGLTGLSDRLAQAGREMSGLETEVSAFAQNAALTQTDFGRIQQGQTDLAASINAYQAQLDGGPDPQRLATTNADTAAKLVDLEQELQQLEGIPINELVKQNDLSVLREKLDRLRQQNGQVWTDLASLDLGNLNQTAANLRQTVVQNEQNLDSLRSQVDSLDRSAQGFSTRSAALNRTTNDLSGTSFSALDVRRHVVERELVQMEGDLNRQRASSADLAEQQQDWARELTDLRQQLPARTAEQLPPDQQALIDRYETAIARSEALSRTIATSERELDQLQDNAAGLMRALAPVDLHAIESDAREFSARSTANNDALTTATANIGGLVPPIRDLETQLSGADTALTRQGQRLQAYNAEDGSQKANDVALNQAQGRLTSLEDRVKTQAQLQKMQRAAEQKQVDTQTKVQKFTSKVAASAVTKLVSLALPKVMPWRANRATSFPNLYQAVMNQPLATVQPSEAARSIAKGMTVLPTIADIFADSRYSKEAWARRRGVDSVQQAINLVGANDRVLISDPAHVSRLGHAMSPYPVELSQAPLKNDTQNATKYFDIYRKSPERAAIVDLAIGGADLNDPRVAEKMRALMTANPFAFKAIALTWKSGEVTHATDAATAKPTAFEQLLSLSEETGIALSIRADVISPKMKPEGPDKVGYFSETKATSAAQYTEWQSLMDVIARHPDANVVIRQMGLSKFVTADPQVHFEQLSQALAKFDTARADAASKDPQRGKGSLRFDLSGDPGPGSSSSVAVGRYVRDAAMRAALLEFMKNSPDTVMTGSGGILAFTKSQMNSAANLLTDVYAEMATNPNYGPDLLHRVGRQNYVELFNNVNERLLSWTQDQLRNKNQTTEDLDAMAKKITNIQKEQNVKARALFDVTMQALQQASFVDPALDNNYSASSLHDKAPGNSTRGITSPWLGTHERTFNPNDATEAQRKAVVWGATRRAGLVAASGVSYFGATTLLHAATGTKIFSSAAGATRAVISFVRPYYTEYVRQSNMALFETNKVKGSDPNATLDEFLKQKTEDTSVAVAVIANRALKVSKSVNVPDGKLEQAVTRFAQFGSDYSYLVKVANANKWTTSQFEDAAMELIGLFQNDLDADTSFQMTTLNALDPATKISQRLGLVSALTRGVNLESNLQSLLSAAGEEKLTSSIDNAVSQGGGAVADTAVAGGGAANDRTPWKAYSWFRLGGTMAGVAQNAFKGYIDAQMLSNHPGYAILGLIFDAMSGTGNGGLATGEGLSLFKKGGYHARVQTQFLWLAAFGALANAILQIIEESNNVGPPTPAPKNGHPSGKTTPNGAPPTPTPTNGASTATPRPSRPRPTPQYATSTTATGRAKSAG
jgi:hypothetical protein